MKHLILLLLLTSSFCLSAQSNSSLDIIAGIDYTYRHIRETDSSSEFIKKSRDKRENGNINWRFGLDYSHRLNSRFIIKMGARLMSLGYHVDINFDDLRFDDQFNGQIFDPSLPSGEDFGNPKLSDNFWFIELPLAVRYEFYNNKLTPYAEAGFGLAYYLIHRGINTSGGEREVTTHTIEDSTIPVQRIQMEGILAFGFNYNIKESIQLFGQPTFRYHLTKMWTTDLKEHLWSAGLEVGLRKWLN